MSTLQNHRDRIRQAPVQSAGSCLTQLSDAAAINADQRGRATKRALALVQAIRAEGQPGLMEVFLAEYGLSTREGVALMCLAEALLRVPDADTIDALIEDKIAPSAWGDHLGRSSSSLVNASTWALMLTGKVLQEDGTGIAAVLHRAVKRLGEPVIRAAVQRAMKELGHQFVLGRDIDEALARAQPLQGQGYSFSYDMLGEAALTAADAAAFFDAYSTAIDTIAGQGGASADIRDRPGISIKLSALHPRYEVSQTDRVLAELVPRVLTLAHQARVANIGFCIDAEECDRLDLSLSVIEPVLRDPGLAGWDGFGVVVQTYAKAAPAVLDWLYALCGELDRKIMIRLVKGAYWDTEIKRAQVEGLTDFPVFTRKTATDVAYLCCAKMLFAMRDRIYPQFASHNAHTVATILELAPDPRSFEFQRLQGMGEALHRQVLQQTGSRCRIYAPVGAHRDLLAYLVRRLLENGANSSFVNQIVDAEVPAEQVAADPFTALEAAGTPESTAVLWPADLYGPGRPNSSGWDLHNPVDLAAIDAARTPFRSQQWAAGPLLKRAAKTSNEAAVLNPAMPADQVGTVRLAGVEDAEIALRGARKWTAAPSRRAAVLFQAADLFQAHFGEFFAVLCREAGKTPTDAVSELREAVDFLRFYGTEAERLAGAPAHGIFACISPWNFPLAIFTGQIAAALAAGNGVIAKPAEATPIIATLATGLLHRAGVPKTALQLLPGPGSRIGAALVSDPRIAGVCFTGSTATAQGIHRAMAQNLAPGAPLIAETGGLNAMIVDSTALPQQAIGDIIASAFRSAGQRCSALRILYLQQDVAPDFLQMLFGAMDELVTGDPWDFACDLGPVIDTAAKTDMTRYIDAARAEGRLLKQIAAPSSGHFIGPAVIEVAGIADLTREVFGPVLHLATYQAAQLDNVVTAINGAGYGLTFAMHSRIDDRVQQVTSRLKVGNIYVNRNQIGAVVGSQPFGGEGLSGTGPKAGGPNYVARFAAPVDRPATTANAPKAESAADPVAVQAALTVALATPPALLRTEDLPGPTGESNRLSLYGRGTVLCLGPSAVEAREQAQIARANGCAAIIVAPGVAAPEGIAGVLPRTALTSLHGFALVVLCGEAEDQRRTRIALAARPGAIIGLVTEGDLAPRCRLERHSCIDTTAAGGNAALLAAAG